MSQRPGATGYRFDAFARTAGGQQAITIKYLYNPDSGSFQFELDGPVPPAATCIYVVEVALPSGDRSLDSNCVPVARENTWIDLTSLPIREDDTKIEGKVGSSVKVVRVFVFSRGNPRYRNPADDLRKLADRVAAKDKDVDYVPLNEFQQVRLASLAGNLVQAIAKQPQGGADPRLDEFNCLAGELHQQFDIAVKDASFSGQYPIGVVQGMCVVVRDLRDGAVRQDGPPAQIVQETYAGWGRVRGTFYLGAAVGRSSGSFGSTDPYVGFYADSNVWNPRLLDKKNLPGQTFHAFRVSLHWFSEARLTQSALPSITDKATEAKQNASQLFQAGLYAPLSFSGLDYIRNGQPYAFFFAPLFKFGVQTPEGNILLRTETTFLPEETTLNGQKVAASEKVTPTEVRDVGAFYTYGVRLGLFRYLLMGGEARNRQVAPDLLSYIDVTFGNHSLYRSKKLIAETPAIGDPKMAGYVPKMQTHIYVTEPRLMLEGRYKIPFMPLQIGVDYNVALKGTEKEPADFRFVFATRVDAAAAIGKVFAKK